MNRNLIKSRPQAMRSRGSWAISNQRDSAYEGGEEVEQEVAEEVPEAFIEEVHGGKDHKEGKCTEGEHEEDLPEVFPKAEDRDEV